MQDLHPDLLRLVANQLPMRNATRLGQAFAGARPAARASLAARRPLNRKIERAGRGLAQRNKEIMAVVTRLLHLLKSGNVPLGFDKKRAQFGGVKGKVWRPPTVSYAMMEIELRVKTVAAPVRGSLMRRSFRVDTQFRRAMVDGGAFPGARRVRNLAEQPVDKAALRAFQANGFTVNTYFGE